jgi:hypothetical protein
METVTRSIQCLRTSDGQETSSSKCQALAGIMPNSTKMCTGTERCGYGLVTSDWGPCSVLCGSGVEERLVECLRSDGIAIDRSNPAQDICRYCVSVCECRCRCRCVRCVRCVGV